MSDRCPHCGRIYPFGEEIPEGSAPVSEQVAIAGPDGRRAVQLLSRNQDHGQKLLADLTGRAVRRMLVGGNPAAAGVLFNDDELAELADGFSAMLATADLMGRVRVRERARLAEERYGGASTFAEWKPYTHPRTRRSGWISGGGLVRYTKPTGRNDTIREDEQQPEPAQPTPDAPPPTASAAPAPVDEKTDAGPKSEKKDVTLGKDKLPKSQAKVLNHPKFHEGKANSILENVFAKGSPEENNKALAASLGMPDDARVWIGEAGPYQGQFTDDTPKPGAIGVRVHIVHPQLGETRRFIGIDKDGKKFIRNEIITVKAGSRAAGLGAQIFSRQVEGAADNGFDYIETHAATGNGTMNGYATWPKFGYDQSLTDPSIRSRKDKAVFERVRAKFPEAKTVLDVMSSPGGAEWWSGTKNPDGSFVRGNGTDLYNARFDLNPDSRSVKVMSRYLEKRAASEATKTSTSPTPSSPTSTPSGPISSGKGSKSNHAERFAEPTDDPFHQFADPPPVQRPRDALDYFRSLVPSLDGDPLRYGPLLDRHAFTLAHATDQALLEKVKRAIFAELARGENATPTVQQLLDAAGVSARNPQYAEMITRTNVMDAFNQGTQAELADPAMQEFFPAWRYDGILDTRTGDDHRPKIGKHYPSTATFSEVRGPRVWNCRCSPTPVSKWEMKGIRVESSW